MFLSVIQSPVLCFQLHVSLLSQWVSLLARSSSTDCSVQSRLACAGVLAECAPTVLLGEGKTEQGEDLRGGGVVIWDDQKIKDRGGIYFVILATVHAMQHKNILFLFDI